MRFPLFASFVVRSRFGIRLGRATRGWGVLVLGPILLTIALVVVVWSGTISRIKQEEQLAAASMKTNNMNIVHVAAASLDQILQRMRLYANMARPIFEQRAGGRADIRLNPIQLGDSAYLRLAVFDVRGQLLYSSARQSAEPELDEVLRRALAIRRLPAGPTPSLLIGRPANQAGDSWRVPLMLPIVTESGQEGYLGALLDLGYFLQLYGEINLGGDGRIEIVDNDGYQLIETSGKAMRGGATFSGTDFHDLILSRRSGSSKVMHPGDTKIVMASFERVEHFPLTVIVSQSYETTTDEIKIRRLRYLWWASLFSLALIAAATAMSLLARRHVVYHRQIMRSEKEKQKLIDALEEEKGHAYHLASHDHLTGMPNRMLFAELANSHLLRARRSRNFYALLFIDLDRFKMVNDTLGHRVGDLLLQAVAARLLCSLRESDVTARFGGDEFVMLLTEVASLEDIEKIAAKVVKEVGKPCTNLDGHDLEVHPSIGIALYPQDGLSIDMLIRNADAAMYEAKVAGRNTYRFYDPSLHGHSALQLELLQQFRLALQNNQFVLHYQPCVSLQDFRVVSLEALVRWQHPQYGLLFPGSFIPLAENHNLIDLLCAYVMDAACRQIDTWRKAGVSPVPVAINVSATQLTDDRLIGEIDNALAAYNVPGNLLRIELTETCLMEQPEQGARVLDALVARNLSIAIDDYGTGYSSLGYLKKLPIDTLKIDRSFIRDIRNDNSDAAIVGSTIALAHNLGLRVVAEGVETREQLVHLKTVGCDEVQGYYLMRPSPAEAIEPVLRAGFIQPV